MHSNVGEIIKGRSQLRAQSEKKGSVMCNLPPHTSTLLSLSSPSHPTQDHILEWDITEAILDPFQFRSKINNLLTNVNILSLVTKFYLHNSYLITHFLPAGISLGIRSLNVASCQC